jgi:uncharacterized protein (DUF433 family)
MDEETELLKRITVNPEIFGGKPIVRGMRIAVEHILGMLAAGATPAEIVEHYSYLEEADVRACLVYGRCGGGTAPFGSGIRAAFLAR